MSRIWLKHWIMRVMSYESCLLVIYRFLFSIYIYLWLNEASLDFHFSKWWFFNTNTFEMSRDTKNQNSKNWFDWFNWSKNWVVVWNIFMFIPTWGNDKKLKPPSRKDYPPTNHEACIKLRRDLFRQTFTQRIHGMIVYLPIPDAQCMAYLYTYKTIPVPC